MALEKYEYPATGSPTNSFLPTRNPSYGDAGDAVDEGIVSDMSGGGQPYNYNEGVKFKTHRRAYTRLAASEYTSYEGFRNAVGGDTFKFTDADAAAHTVTLAVFKRDPKYSSGNRKSFTIEMLEII
jgi:hypothetical protein